LPNGCKTQAHPRHPLSHKGKGRRTEVIYIPKQITLDKYGLSLAEYRRMKKQQKKLCPICEKIPKDEKFRVDHDHVKGWAKLPPEERKKHVRGLVCFFCNRYYLAKAITIRKAENVAKYLRKHEARNT
jgi:hypothetical protein